MADEKEDPARRYQAFLQRWIQLDDQQRALRPHVVRMLGTATWQVSAMDNLRRESPHMAAEVDSDIERSLAELSKKLPLPISYEPSTTLSSTAVAVTSNARVFEALVSARGTNPAPALTEQITRYEALVAEQGREDEAGRRVGLLFAELGPRFAEVQAAVHVARGNQHEEENAAIAMRTFLEKLKGELFDEAREHPRENMTWPLMAERLGGDRGRELLLEQEATHSSVVATLSYIGKARGSAYSFNEAATRFFDHVFVLCGEVLAYIDRG